MATLSLFVSLPLLLISCRWCAAEGEGLPPPLLRRDRSDDHEWRKDGDGGSSGVAAGGELWCVAKNNAEDGALQAALDWACGPGGADCGPIQQGGPCSEPNDIQDHASYAFNDYFLRHGSSPDSCDFSGTAALTSLNPSLNDCKFPSGSSARNGSFSGTSMGSTAGMSGGAPVRLKVWTQPSTVALFTVVVTATTAAAAGGIFR